MDSRHALVIQKAEVPRVDDHVRAMRLGQRVEVGEVASDVRHKEYSDRRRLVEAHLWRLLHRLSSVVCVQSSVLPERVDGSVA